MLQHAKHAFMHEFHHITRYMSPSYIAAVIYDLFEWVAYKVTKTNVFDELLYFAVDRIERVGYELSYMFDVDPEMLDVASASLLMSIEQFVILAIIGGLLYSELLIGETNIQYLYYLF